MSRRTSAILIILISLATAATVKADDGYRLWLRYESLSTAQTAAYRARIKSLIVIGKSPQLAATRVELETGLSGLLGEKTRVSEHASHSRTANHAGIFGVFQSPRFSAGFVARNSRRGHARERQKFDRQ